MGFKERQDGINVTIQGRFDLAFRKICFEIASDIIMAWPVDTGRSRAGWMVGINSIPTDVPNFEAPQSKSIKARKTAASGFATVGLATSLTAYEQFTARDTFYFANNVHYAYYLEYGPYFSKQAPQGVVRLTVQKWRSALG